MNKRLTTILLVLLVVWAGLLSFKVYTLNKELKMTERALVAVSLMTGVYTPADMKASIRQQIRDAHPVQGVSHTVPQLGVQNV